MDKPRNRLPTSGKHQDMQLLQIRPLQQIARTPAPMINQCSTDCWAGAADVCLLQACRQQWTSCSDAASLLLEAAAARLSSNAAAGH